MHIAILENVSHEKICKPLRVDQLKVSIDNQLCLQSFQAIPLYFQ